MVGGSAILLGAMSWAFGVRYSATSPLPKDPFVRAATTLLCGAALLLAASAVTGPAEVIDISRALKWPGVCGNTDEMLWRPERFEELGSLAPERHGLRRTQDAK